jgi:alpha-ketoglutaric semialdehyde dehydrogenase
MIEYKSITEIERLLGDAQEAFFVLKSRNFKERAAFMHLVADEIEALGDELIQAANAETNLPVARLTGEKGRTVNQWRSYGDALANGNVLDVRIDTANAERTPPKPDLRKGYAGIGPVLVFGASNFPFAFSTLGGDTASAIAAGCPVIVKAHSGHKETGAIMAKAMYAAIEKAGWPVGTFTQVFSKSYDVATFLVSHPIIKAVGFTGSYNGGKMFFDLANQRPDPIPVFAEMGSVNPVFLFEGKLKNAGEATAKQYIASLTMGVGQFCTNPGIMFVPEHEALTSFIDVLKEEILKVAPAAMLNAGIASAYHKNKVHVSGQDGVEIIAAVAEGDQSQGNPILAQTTAEAFLSNPNLGHEVFGPFGLLVTYKSIAQLEEVAKKLEGQITISLLAEPEDLRANPVLISLLQDKCGRYLVNNFPTGVEVAYAMNHGGPFPASSDGRFTSVGPDAIKRFARPVSYQNFGDEFLPDELKNANPLGIWRTVDGKLTQDAI